MAWPPTTHQDVQDDLSGGHGWASSMSDRLALGEVAYSTAPVTWTTGRYVAAVVNGTAATTLAATANRLELTPLYFSTPRSVDQVVVNVTTAGTAGHVARLGIYNSNASTGLPTTVLADAGTVPVDATGVKAAAVSQTLSGLVWLAMTAQSGTFAANPSAACALVGTSTTVSGNPTLMLSRASTAATSALPNLTGDGTVLGTAAGTVVRVLLRAA